MLSSTRPSCASLRLHGLDLAVQLGALPGNLGEPLGTLLGDLGKGGLELRPGRRHHARDAGVEAGPELLLQLAQYRVEKHFRICLCW